MPRSFDGNSANRIAAHAVNGNYSTLAAWIKLNSIGTQWAIASKWQTGDRNSVLQVTAAGKLSFAIISAALGGQAVVGATTLPLDEWIHVCGRYGGDNEQAVWLDGVKDGTRAGTGFTLTASGTFTIGYRSESGVFSFDGLIAEVGYWGRGLIDAEIQALAGGISPSRIPNELLAHLPLWGQDSPELDIVQGIAATIVGTVPASTDFPSVGSPWSADG